MLGENMNHSQCWERLWRKWEGGGEQMLLRRHVPIFCRDCFLSTRLLYPFLNGPTTFCFSDTNCLSLWSMYYCLSIGERRADVVEETRSNLLLRLLFVAWLLYYSHFLFLLILSYLPPLSLCFYHCLSVWYFKRCRLDQYSASWSRRQRIPCWQKISTANLTLRMVLVVERGVRDQDGLIRVIGIWVASSCPSW